MQKQEKELEGKEKQLVVTEAAEKEMTEATGNQKVAAEKRPQRRRKYRKMVRQYRLRGFLVKCIWVDNEFDPLREDFFVNRSDSVYLCSQGT